MRNENGFTLIELMIAVIIIGILSSIAYPSYTQFVAKGARADGLAGLMDVANRQEQFYLDNRKYTTDMTKLGLNADPWVVDNTYYSIDAVVVNNTDFTLTASAKGTQVTRDPNCVSITLNATGIKLPEECWK
ncbi:type IV pilin protein [Shewanella sp. 1_MG-2023]|uniref:type IV pilin protein n=1 Tax=unclassified Shewanella TaxID=196818 RepID=UPI0026E38041|nr:MULTISPECIES: type IV pilin protein [unclassified Shewanella]MDO6610061.1 type IV pilin protein [Shewanella sp. 7_MG-2023]MDO6769797.1 type IV pilin protein [Shewanella sp. 2_MG-2023]MDO6792861.1 type IV pilin protein [Shewanella sp. 1_MG-2023]